MKYYTKHLQLSSNINLSERVQFSCCVSLRAYRNLILAMFRHNHSRKRNMQKKFVCNFVSKWRKTFNEDLSFSGERVSKKKKFYVYSVIRRLKREKSAENF